MTFGQSELVTGLGLSLVVILARLVVVAWWWRRAVRHATATARLSDGAVLIVEAGTVIEASAQAEDLLGPTIGQQARAVISLFLGPDSDPVLGAHSGKDSGSVLAALAGLERSGDAIHLLTTNAAGRHFELAGQAHGSQLRLVLREAGLLDAELNRALAGFAAHDQALSRREIETQTLSGLLAGAPIAVWNRAPDGSIAWSAGQIPTSHGVVTASAAAAMAVAQAKFRDNPERVSERGDAPGSAERFRLEIAGAENDTTIPLDAIETIGAEGVRLGLAIDASGALRVEQTLSRFVQTMAETFAHLNVGLAIFDRNQTLAIFNPALVRMWQADPAWQPPN